MNSVLRGLAHPMTVRASEVDCDRRPCRNRVDALVGVLKELSEERALVRRILEWAQSADCGEVVVMIARHNLGNGWGPDLRAEDGMTARVRPWESPEKS